MATLVGMQSDFAEALRELVELEYDAHQAYETAISRLDNAGYKEKLGEFMEDHHRHIQELSELLRQRNEKVPTGPSAVKQWLAKGKVVLANLIGDKAILAAMTSNELDTNTAYERMVERNDKWPESEDILARGLADERRHKAWLDQI